jgi:mono/diheme cytochrome c family protein
MARVSTAFWYWAAALAVIAINWAQPVSAQEAADVEFEDLEPRLIAEFSDGSGNPYRRLDEEPNLTRDDLDVRLKPGHIKLRWTGYLLIQLAGEHRFHGFAWNKLRLKIGDQLVLDGIGPCESEPVTLPLGFHRLELTAEGDANPNDAARRPRVQLLWSGPGFGIEPVPSRLLYHDANQKVDDSFEQGRRLASALRCAACHDLPLLGDAQPAPALDLARGNLTADWAAHWLDDERVDAKAGAADRRMPLFKLSADEAQALSRYLCGDAAATEIKRTKPTQDAKGVEAGRLLTLQIGCLACHSVGEHGTRTITGGGDLTRIADKRPAGFFARWLKDPAEVNRHHRMPIFDLSVKEIDQIAAYLQ